MKKLIAILLTMVVLLGTLSGCGKAAISKADIEANPQEIIKSAISKSFEASPLGSVVELEEPESTSIDVSITPEDKNLGYINFNANIANNKLAALIGLDADLEGEEFKGQLFIDNSNLAIKAEALKEIFKSDTIGIKLENIVENFKKSGWYELIKDSGLEEEFASEMAVDGLDEIKLEDIAKAYEQYLNDVKTIEKECKKYDIQETTIEIEKKKIDCFVVEETLSEELVTKFESATVKFYESLANAVGMKAEDFNVEQMTDDVKEEFNQIIDDYSVTYTIEKKTGAMVEIKAIIDTEIEEEDVYAYVKVDFGAEPTKTFCPSFELTMEADGQTVYSKGISKIDTKQKAFVLGVEYSSKYDDTDMSDYNEECEFKFTLDKNSNFTIEASDGDEDIKIGGIFKVDGSKMDISFDTAEIEDAENMKVSIAIDFNAKAPTGFEYDDILKYTKKEAEDLINKISDMVGSSYNDDYGYEVDDEDLLDFGL